MREMTAQWYRPFRRHVNSDGSFDSICVACCRTIARYQVYDELGPIEQTHRCEEPDLRRARKGPATVREASPLHIPAVA